MGKGQEGPGAGVCAQQQVEFSVLHPKHHHTTSKEQCQHACSVPSVVSDSLRPHGLQPARLLCPWDSPGKNTGAGCHALLQSICPTQRSNLCLLHCKQMFHLLSHLGSAPPPRPWQKKSRTFLFWPQVVRQTSAVAPGQSEPQTSTRSMCTFSQKIRTQGSVNRWDTFWPDIAKCMYFFSSFGTVFLKMVSLNHLPCNHIGHLFVF